MMEDGDSVVLGVLKNSHRGATITEIVDKTDLPRGVVRISLARLEGANKLSFRKVGMAKLYFIK